MYDSKEKIVAAGEVVASLFAFPDSFVQQHLANRASAVVNSVRRRFRWGAEEDVSSSAEGSAPKPHSLETPPADVREAAPARAKGPPPAKKTTAAARAKQPPQEDERPKPVRFKNSLFIASLLLCLRVFVFLRRFEGLLISIFPAEYPGGRIDATGRR